MRITPEEVQATQAEQGIALVPIWPSHAQQGEWAQVGIKGTSVVLTQCAADIKPEPITWLWYGYLPKGKLTILAGVGGAGKSTVTFNFAATVTNSGLWPDGTQCEVPGNVLIWSSEDDPADTIVPRLIAAGADLNKVHIIRGAMNEQGEILSFDPARDIPTLRSKTEAIGGASLLIVDPVVSAVAGDMHKANDVRRSLQMLVDFAASFDCCVVGISHFSKGSKGSSPAERVIGSQAFSALARIVLVCAKQEDNTSRVLARAKSNISQDDGGYSYSLLQVVLDGGIEASRVEWGDPIEGTAREILSDVEGEQDNSSSTDTDDAEQVLQAILQPGEMLRGEVVRKMKGEGFTDKVMRRARERLSVIVRREGFGKDQQTFWSLPEKPALMPTDATHAQPVQRAQLEDQGTSGAKRNPWEDDL